MLVQIAKPGGLVELGDMTKPFPPKSSLVMVFSCMTALAYDAMALRQFEERYGAIGQDFIEAHHLRPIASSEEGWP